MDTHPFVTALLLWYKQNARDLPWRHTRDPYAIWLSEIILQQTRVVQGMDYWYRFIKRFPNVESLASAQKDEVMLLWEGLGYYSRAENLYQAAKQIVEMGHFPDDMQSILSVKGIGPYTAAAIASIAFGRQVAAIDGNAYRLMSRYFGISTPIDTGEGKKEFQALGQKLIPLRDAGAYNQAVMDYASMICTPKNPSCQNCVLLSGCKAFYDGIVDKLPVKKNKVKIQTCQLSYIYITCDDHVLLHQRPTNGIWRNLWEFYLITDGTLPSTFGPLTLVTKDVKHVLTHRIIMADLYKAEVRKRIEIPGYKWVPQSEISDYAMPKLMYRLLETLPAG